MTLQPGEKVRWKDGRPFRLREGSSLTVVIDPDGGSPSIYHERSESRPPGTLLVVLPVLLLASFGEGWEPTPQPVRYSHVTCGCPVQGHHPLASGCLGLAGNAGEDRLGLRGPIPVLAWRCLPALPACPVPSVFPPWLGGWRPPNANSSVRCMPVCPGSTSGGRGRRCRHRPPSGQQPSGCHTSSRI